MASKLSCFKIFHQTFIFGSGNDFDYVTGTTYTLRVVSEMKRLSCGGHHWNVIGIYGLIAMPRRPTRLTTPTPPVVIGHDKMQHNVTKEAHNVTPINSE